MEFISIGLAEFCHKRCTAASRKFSKNLKSTKNRLCKNRKSDSGISDAKSKNLKRSSMAKSQLESLEQYLSETKENDPFKTPQRGCGIKRIPIAAAANNNLNQQQSATVQTEYQSEISESDLESELESTLLEQESTPNVTENLLKNNRFVEYLKGLTGSDYESSQETWRQKVYEFHLVKRIIKFHQNLPLSFLKLLNVDKYTLPIFNDDNTGPSSDSSKSNPSNSDSKLPGFSQYHTSYQSTGNANESLVDLDLDKSVSLSREQNISLVGGRYSHPNCEQFQHSREQPTQLPHAQLEELARIFEEFFRDQEELGQMNHQDTNFNLNDTRSASQKLDAKMLKQFDNNTFGAQKNDSLLERFQRNNNSKSSSDSIESVSNNVFWDSSDATGTGGSLSSRSIEKENLDSVVKNVNVEKKKSDITGVAVAQSECQ